MSNKTTLRIVIIISALIIAISALQACSSISSSQSDIRYIKNWMFQRNPDSDSYSILFSLTNENNEFVKGKVYANVKIENEKGEVVYTRLLTISENDFNIYSFALKPDQLMANVLIQPNEIKLGNSANGTVYLKVYNDVIAFDEISFSVVNALPVVPPELSYDNPPLEITNLNVLNEIDSIINIDKISYEYNSTISTITVSLSGQKIYGSNLLNLDLIEYKIYDDDVVLTSGSVILNSISAGEKFIDSSLVIFNVNPGEKYRLSFPNGKSVIIDSETTNDNSATITTSPEDTTEESSEVTTDSDITTGNHSHLFAEAWSVNTSNHWHECLCGETADKSTHLFTEWTITKQPSCSSKGQKERACTVCGFVEVSSIDKLPHSAVSIPAQAATCLESGLTEGSYCSVCGATITTQKTIPATGHHYEETVISPTVTEEGYTLHVCSGCGDSYKDSFVEATGSEGLAFESNNDGTCTITGIGTCTDTGIHIPRHINGLEVTKIGDNAFENCSFVTSVFIPDTVTTIGKRVFYQTSITEITIPESVNNIERNVFFKANKLERVYYYSGCTLFNKYESDKESFLATPSIKEIVFGCPCVPLGICNKCESLERITLLSSVTRIGERAFQGCTGLHKIELSNNLVTIDPHAFDNCTSLQSIDLPNSLKEIQRAAFINCSSLSSIIIPNSVTIIDHEVFYYCTSLTSIIIPSSVHTLGGAFLGCSNLKSVTLPDSISEIALNSFTDCTSLESIVIPDSVSIIGMDAFRGCTNLKNISIPNSVKTIQGGAFKGCSSLEEIALQRSITEIGSGAFAQCVNLKRIILLSNVSLLSYKLFEGCSSLKEISIPKSVTSLEIDCLKDCSALTDIYYDGTVSEWNIVGKALFWAPGTGDYVIHCSDGNLSKS